MKHAEKFEQWLKMKNLKERTIESYMYYFFKFRENVFNQETALKFISKKTTRNSVARNFINNLKKFLIQNYKELGLTIDERLEASEVELPSISGRKRKRIIKTLTSEQVLEIEKHLESEKEKLMLLCSYYGGLRIGELMKIKVISFNWNEWKKNINSVGECKVLGKGDKEGLAFFPPNLMIRIAKFIKSQRGLSVDSYIFVRGYLDFKRIRGVSSTWERKFKEAAIKSGIIKTKEGKVIEETNISPHILRHSLGTNLHKAGVDIRKVQQLLRHSSITSTQIYTHINKEDLKRDVSKLYGISEKQKEAQQESKSTS